VARPCRVRSHVIGRQVGACTISWFRLAVQHYTGLCMASTFFRNDCNWATYHRYCLTERETVPFMDILAAVKSLAGLMADSEAWLQPLLHQQAVKQLQDIAVHSLPLLAKTYPRNQRVQQLLQDINSCLHVRHCALQGGALLVLAWARSQHWTPSWQQQAY